MENREHLVSFNPIIKEFSSASIEDLNSFYVGDEYHNFSEYIQAKTNGNNSEAIEDSLNGNGVTHLIWNDFDKIHSDLVAYFTISVNALPYDDGIEDVDETDDLSNIPSIPVIEIRMFAVAEKYQDIFFVKDNFDLPIAAWCLIAIIQYCEFLSSEIVGCKALYLHSLPSAEHFYVMNGFKYLPKDAKPLFSVDQDYKAMWFPIREVLLRNDV